LQDHLRDRLTGAAIVVVVVVLLVPELFHGRPATDSGTGTTPTAGPPVRSYTIDLRDSAGDQQPAVASPVVPTAPAVAGGGTVTSAPAPTAVAAPTVAVPVPAKPAPGSAPPSAHGSATLSGWAVQVGSFARRDFAERMAKDVTAKGFPVEVAGPDDRGLYRVRSPPHAERAAANALRQKMQASGLKPIVNKVP